jgi:hypothetical protein
MRKLDIATEPVTSSGSGQAGRRGGSSAGGHGVRARAEMVRRYRGDWLAVWLSSGRMTSLELIRAMAASTGSMAGTGADAQAVIDGNRSGGQDREDKGCFLGRHWRLWNPASGGVVREGGA